LDGFATVAMLSWMSTSKPVPKALQERGLNLLANRCKRLCEKAPEAK
jgi:hypothetical protein